MNTPDMMSHLRALPPGLRGMGIGDPDDGGRIEAAEVVRWAIGEIDRLRLAIRRLADQDALLSVCDGNVTVTIDAALTDAEREALCFAAATCRGVGRAVRSWPENQWADIIDALLKRHEKGGEA